MQKPHRGEADCKTKKPTNCGYDPKHWQFCYFPAFRNQNKRINEERNMKLIWNKIRKKQWLTHSLHIPIRQTGLSILWQKAKIADYSARPLKLHWEILFLLIFLLRPWLDVELAVTKRKNCIIKVDIKKTEKDLHRDPWLL